MTGTEVDVSQVKVYPQLPSPRGELEVIWKIDPGRYEIDAPYRDRCRDFVLDRVRGGSLSDAAVLTDQAGVMVLYTTSMERRDGGLRRNSISKPVVVRLDPGTVLP